MSQPNKAFRTYGSKPRKVTSTQLWDGTKDVPRRAVLSENISDTNERKSNSAIGGFMKGVVEWLSPRKTRNSAARKGSARSTRSGKENQLARETRFSLSDEDDEAEVEEADLSIASTATSTLVSSTPKKENGKEADISVEKKQGIDLLLEFCSVNEVVDFVEHIQGLLESATISKLGEASYSEVFTLTHSDGTTTVLKVIPFNGTDENDPSMSNLQDLLQEIRISTAMAKVEGFADFQGATIVQGTYPEPLLSSWDTYKTTHKSENDRPSKFPSTQTYCILHLAHHGNDLESHSITEWSEAAHIFWSVVRTLSRGEEAHEFEHRDLHWGNILIDQSDEDAMMERLLENLNLNGEGGASEVMLDGGWGGVKVTVIDYTLSRAKVDDVVGEIAHYGFEDETLFEGKRDYQFDIYRQMRALMSDENTGVDWEQYRPATNVLWLHYLANKLLYAKQLPTPVSRLSARNQSRMAGGRKRGHERSFSVILEGEDKSAYEGLLAVYNKINPKNTSIGSAAEVLELGRENGWVL